MRDIRDPETLGLMIHRVMEREGCSVLTAADAVAWSIDPIKSLTTNVPGAGVGPNGGAPSQNGVQGHTAPPQEDTKESQ